MPRTDRSFDIRAEHPKRVYVDAEMKKIRVKKAAVDQLPQRESDRTVEVLYREVTNWPERVVGKESLA
jgi:hypothetical protein